MRSESLDRPITENAPARHYVLARHEPISRSAMSISPATAAGSWRMPSMTASSLTSRARAVLEHLAGLWSYGVRLEEVDAKTDRVLKTHEVPAQR